MSIKGDFRFSNISKSSFNKILNCFTAKILKLKIAFYKTRAASKAYSKALSTPSAMTGQTGVFSRMLLVRDAQPILAASRLA
jgi:hypothetical protein